MTTPRRLKEKFNIDIDLVEGDWFLITLGDQPGEPPAWVLDASADYRGSLRRTNVIGLERLSRNDKSDSTRLLSLIAWCNVGPAALPSANITLPIGQAPLGVRILDVGHASCVAIHAQHEQLNTVLGYYDVGGPVFFHHKSFPTAFDEQCRVPKKNGFVVLSHWDFDHYSLAVTKLKSLQNLTWFAPDQAVGPNCARLQSLIKPRLNFIGAPSKAIAPGLRMVKGTASAGDRNNSGYALKVRLKSGNILLTGDVGYDYIANGAKEDLIGLGITHHGGNGCENPPSPALLHAKAAVSYGNPNRYGHPVDKHLVDHDTKGWTVESTAATSISARGDIWLP
jgi:hypothetical protein